MKKRFVKIISLVLAVSVIFGSAAVMSFAAIDGYVLGVADARKVLRDAVGLEKLSDADRKIADMDFDSVISVADARTVLRLAVQLDIIDGKTYEKSGAYLMHVGIDLEVRCADYNRIILINQV